MYFMGLSKVDKKNLESEVISNEARLKLTRLVRKRCASNDNNVSLINRNHFINVGRTVLDLPIYRLEPDDMGMYMSEEFGWHIAETELIMRRPDTVQLVEILADMVQQGMLDMWSVNKVLAEDNSSVRFKIEGFDEDIEVTILSETELEEENVDPDHPNIRILSQRMDQAFEAKDYAGVLHASANIFETLAKLVFNNPNVENKTLASLFDGYRKRSELPEPLLDYILATYNRRNVEPLAGHGATNAPTVTAKDATILIEMTRMCVRLERRLALQELDAVPTTRSGGTVGENIGAAAATPAPAKSPAKAKSSRPKAKPKPKKKP
ncbi:hypothetical protein [Sphingobium xenophagum]|uniref:hypothetical protein n=1 Tax=Sphingobium xenophagum TaxID=121428 RepID=UPI00241C8C6A|nr:hypothetical protein [Sphingobium xenophagum]